MAEQDPIIKRPAFILESGTYYLAHNPNLIRLRKELNSYLNENEITGSEAMAIRAALPYVYVLDKIDKAKRGHRHPPLDEEAVRTIKNRTARKILNLGYSFCEILDICEDTADIYAKLIQPKPRHKIHGMPGVYVPQGIEPATAPKKKEQLPPAKRNNNLRKHYAYIDESSLRKIKKPEEVISKARAIMVTEGLRDKSPEEKDEWINDVTAILRGEKLRKDQTKDWLGKQLMALKYLRMFTPFN